MDERTLYVVNDEPERNEEPAPSPLVGQPAPTEADAPKPLEEASGSAREEKKAKPKPLNPSRFEGCGFCYFWLLVGCGLLSVATLSVMVPWCYGWVASYQSKRTVIDGKRFVFDGHGGEIILRWLLYVFLFLVTGGVFGFWVPKKLRDWRLSHTHLAPKETPDPIPVGEVSIVGETPEP